MVKPPCRCSNYTTFGQCRHAIDTAQVAYPRMRQGSADTTMVTNKCPECGQTMWRQEGCVTCPVCGFSRC